MALTIRAFIITCIAFGVFHTATPFASEKTHSLKIIEHTAETPEFPEVQFFAIDPPNTLQQKLQTILYGMTIDVPPQYDHYGYDIRRYMTSVGGKDVFTNPDRVREELAKVEHAAKILKAWQDKNIEDIRSLEAEVEAGDADPLTLQEFRLNKAKAQAFFIEADSWIKNHYALLQFLTRIRGQYYFEESEFEFTFQNADALKKFDAIYTAQQKSLTELHKYVPFRVMVY